MSSFARIVSFLLKVLKFNKMFLDIEKSKGDRNIFTEVIFSYREKDNSIKPSEKLFKKYHIDEVTSVNHKSHILRGKSKTGKIIVYFHGGAYVKGPLPLQWKFLSEIANATEYDIAVLDYPKTPEYTCIDAIEYCIEFCEKYLTEYGWENIFFMGDSAGGGLALSVIMKLKDLDKPLPVNSILLSPWLDVSMSNVEVDDYRGKDHILTVEGLVICGEFYAGDVDTKDWKVSPMFGNLNDLPETHIFVGGSELFYPDCRDFADMIKDAGRRVVMHYYKDMQHDWPLIPNMPEAKNAIEEIIQILI